MNEKLSFQNIADTLAQKAGVQKKVAETFSKAFFDTIAETMSAGESIKIKGLGTFKLVEVGDRESVNVSTGMRFVIPGYKKVAFTAEDSVVEELNAQTESAENTEVIGHTESTENVAEPSVLDHQEESVSAPDIDTLIQVPEPEQVEQPRDSFAGIDMLISTPESVEDVRQQYEEAKAKMEVAVEEARKANAEKLRLEKLLERLEKNVAPEVVAHTNLADEVTHTDKEESTEKEESPEPVAAVAVSDDEKTEEEKRQEAFNRVMMEQPKQPEPEPQQEQPAKKNVWLTVLIILLVAVLGVFVFLIYRNIEAVEQVPTTTQVAQPAKPSKPAAKPTKPAAKPAAPKVDKDSLVKAQQADSVKVAKPEKEAPKPETPKVKEEPKPERPKTHVMQRGESLTRISQKYYGTKDSVRAILRINTFANPDNIPVGAVVKLP